MKGIYSIRDNSASILDGLLEAARADSSGAWWGVVMFLDTTPLRSSPGYYVSECSQLLNVRLDAGQKIEVHQIFRKLQDRRQYASIAQTVSVNATGVN